MNNEYIPGSCNISAAEIKKRRRMGEIGLFTSLILSLAYLLVILYLNFSPLFGLLLFFPLVMTFVGFLQANNQFCVAYGLGNVYNLTLAVGNTTEVTDKRAKKKDQIKSYKILAQAIGISVGLTIVVTAIGFLIS